MTNIQYHQKYSFTKPSIPLIQMITTYNKRTNVSDEQNLLTLHLSTIPQHIMTLYNRFYNNLNGDRNI